MPDDANEDRPDFGVAGQAASGANQSPLDPAFQRMQVRIDAVCDLVDAEISGEDLGDEPLQRFLRRVSQDVDAVMAESIEWLDPTAFMQRADAS